MFFSSTLSFPDCRTHILYSHSYFFYLAAAGGRSISPSQGKVSKPHPRHARQGTAGYLPESPRCDWGSLGCRPKSVGDDHRNGLPPASQQPLPQCLTPCFASRRRGRGLTVNIFYFKPATGKLAIGPQVPIRSRQDLGAYIPLSLWQT